MHTQSREEGGLVPVADPSTVLNSYYCFKSLDFIWASGLRSPGRKVACGKARSKRQALQEVALEEDWRLVAKMSHRSTRH